MFLPSTAGGAEPQRPLWTSRYWASVVLSVHVPVSPPQVYGTKSTTKVLLI